MTEKNKKPLEVRELCWSGAAEAMRYGCPDRPMLSNADLKAVVKARQLFEGLTDQQMAVALLLLMVDLGRRIECN